MRLSDTSRPFMSIAVVNLLIADHEIMNSNQSGMTRFVHFVLSRHVLIDPYISQIHDHFAAIFEN